MCFQSNNPLLTSSRRYRGIRSSSESIWQEPFKADGGRGVRRGRGDHQDDDKMLV